MGDKETVFLTGATGFLGSYLLSLFLERGHTVYALARSSAKKNAKARVIDLLKFWNQALVKDNLDNRLTVVEGDITMPNLGINSDKFLEELSERVDMLIHSAALAHLRAPLDLIRKINVTGTQKVLNFASNCKNLSKLVYLSTAYIVGSKSGVEFDEKMLDVGQEFNNTYERSKYEAELVVSGYSKQGLPVSIIRPSMIMGSSKDGKTTNFHLIYEPLHFFAQGIYDKFPANVDCLQNLINVDTVCEAIYLLSQAPDCGTYHIISKQDTIVGFLMEVAADYFGFKLPEFIPAEKFDFAGWTPAQKALAEPYIPYFNYRTRFLSEKTQKVLSEKNFNLPEIDEENLLRVFEYCNNRGFIKRKA